MSTSRPAQAHRSRAAHLARHLRAWRVLGVLAVLAAPARAGVIHVDRQAAGTSTGASWTDAFTDLQDALAVAQSGDEVWVAEGAYTPASGGLDPKAVFVIPSGVRLYGGFAGSEVVLTQRDPALHVVTLSGDLLGDDAQGPDHQADNSHRILEAEFTAPGTQLDGFVVRGEHWNPDIASYPYALRVKDGSLLIRGCTFEDNHTAVRCTQPGTTVIVDCLFRNNHNTTDLASAINVKEGHTLDVRRTTFSANVGDLAPALTLYQSSARFHDCEFVGNGATAVLASAGVAYSIGGQILLSNCTFVGNFAGGKGGSVWKTYESEVVFSNCILWANSAPGAAASEKQIVTYFDWSVTLVNCLFEGWTGQFPGLENSGADPLFVDLLGPDGLVETNDGDLRLSPGSPAIDSGTNAAVPSDAWDDDADGDTTEPDPLDLRRVSRFEDDPDTADLPGEAAPVVDRGASEFSRWTNLGQALGASTAPLLVGSGSWKPGQPIGLSITGAKASATGVVVVGASQLAQPFKGGVMVPHPDFGAAIVTDVQGKVATSGILPVNSPPGFETFLQAWFIDASGPQGFTATNAVSGLTP